MSSQRVCDGCGCVLPAPPSEAWLLVEVSGWRLDASEPDTTTSTGETFEVDVCSPPCLGLWLQRNRSQLWRVVGREELAAAAEADKATPVEFEARPTRRMIESHDI